MYSKKIEEILKKGKKLVLNRVAPIALAATFVVGASSAKAEAANIEFDSITINAQVGNEYATETDYKSNYITEQQATEVENLMQQIDVKYDAIYNIMANGGFAISHTGSKENSMARLLASINEIENSIKTAKDKMAYTSKLIVEKYLTTKQNELKLVFSNFIGISVSDLNAYSNKNTCVFANSISNNNLVNVAIYEKAYNDYNMTNVVSFDDSNLSNSNVLVVVPKATISNGNTFNTTYTGISINKNKADLCQTAIDEIDKLYEKVENAISKSGYGLNSISRQDSLVAINGDTNLINNSVYSKYTDNEIKNAITQYLQYKQNEMISLVSKRTGIRFNEYVEYNKTGNPIRISEEQGFVYYKLNNTTLYSMVDNGYIKTSDIMLKGTSVNTNNSNVEKNKVENVTIDTCTGINLTVDGAFFTPMDANGNKVTPFIYKGTTYLPARALTELFNADISWDSATHTVSLVSKGYEKVEYNDPVYGDVFYYELPMVPNDGTLPSKTLYDTKLTGIKGVNILFNGTPYVPTDANGNTVDVYVINGTTYLPARAIVSLFGSDIKWDKENITVVIERNPYVNQQNNYETITPSIDNSNISTNNSNSSTNNSNSSTNNSNSSNGATEGGVYYEDENGNKIYVDNYEPFSYADNLDTKTR